MRVLIIEDDEFKQRRIAQAVHSWYQEAEISIARSVNSGLTYISGVSPDVILLDMSLTTFDIGPGEPGGRPQNFGGFEILRQMDRLQIAVPVIVITQHERFATGSREVHLSALRRELGEQHSNIFQGLVYYNSARGDWQKTLRHLLKDIFRPAKTSNASQNTARRR